MSDLMQGFYKDGLGVSKLVPVAVDVAGRLLGSGGSGGSGSISSTDVAIGIDASVDINIIVNALVRVSAVPLAQIALSVAAGTLNIQKRTTYPYIRTDFFNTGERLRLFTYSDQGFVCSSAVLNIFRIA